MKMNLSNGNYYSQKIDNKFISDRKLKPVNTEYKDIRNVVIVNTEFFLMASMYGYLKSLSGTLYNQEYHNVEVIIVPCNANINIDYFIKRSYTCDTLYYFVVSISNIEFRYLSESMKLTECTFYDCSLSFKEVGGLYNTEVYDPRTHKALNDRRILDYKKLKLDKMYTVPDPDTIYHINNYYSYERGF